jgi:hypothetical protein
MVLPLPINHIKFTSGRKYEKSGKCIVKLVPGQLFSNSSLLICISEKKKITSTLNSD